MRLDLKKHRIAGFAIAFTVAVLAWFFLPAMPQPPIVRALLSCVIGILVARLAGRAKEYWWDRRHPGRTVDRDDWVMTTRGGCEGGLLFAGLWLVASVAGLQIAG